MTEEEAKTKWCPFARTVQTDGTASSMPRNRIGNQDTMTTDADRLLGMQCIGSASMAWRWQEAYPRQAEDTFANRSTTQGFCGLSGKL